MILLAVLLGAAIVAFVVAILRLNAAEARAAQFEARARGLSKYEAVVDAEAHASRISADAQQQAQQLHSQAGAQATAVLAQAQQRAAALLSEAAVEVAKSNALQASVQAGAEAIRSAATLEASQIVSSANQRAEAIAGDALATKQDAVRLERTVAALKNQIEGYGDRYIVPTIDLIDELAEQFGYAEAGQALKAARERMREMIRSRAAASCDYVEENRRTTAEDFVLDAFNGKVATVLASVREDNYGTLSQKIEDAFTLVNQNGAAFRNARITAAFLQVRLEELRWAVVAQELKAKEREEQRELKERIREEERAQREFERAQKEAEKEEEMLRRAMEKAQKEYDRAGIEQKAKFEEQLRELGERLRVAEEKGQRALSMAQQTKAGHVYVISNVGSFGDHVYKIGLTRRLEPLDRIRELGDASVPFEFDVHALISSNDAPALERDLHKRFVRTQVNKVNPRKEFFRINLVEVRGELERIGCKTEWTMTAMCREYKETQAIERAMQQNKISERDWAAQQMRAHDAAMQEPEREKIG